MSRRSVESLAPYAGNARTHSAAQVGQIARSIAEFGFTVPVLVDEAGGIIAGHGRVLAAKELGLPDVPVMVAAGWSADQKRAYVLADNKIALNGGWDDDLLKAELGALIAADFDLGLTGFDVAELADLGLGPVRGDPEAAPEPPAVPVSRLGDLWLCGAHRVLCGDATSAAAVIMLLGDATPHLMVTDPPYGVDYDPTWRDEAGGQFGDGKTKMRGSVANDDRADWSAAWGLFPGDVAYVWHASLKTVVAAAALEGSGFALKAQVIWHKQHFTLMRQGYHWQHEPCWYAVRAGRRAHWHGDRKQTSVWDIQSLNPAGGNKTESKTGHGTQKPTECMRRPIVNNSAEGDAVYDPFLGSGTTVIAAEMERRKCYGLEIAPEYVDVTVRRWQEFTGETATLEADARSFADVADERLPASARAA